MELSDLVGKHTLTGCDQAGVGDANAFVFVLDGVAYRAQEDGNDGYRSALGEIAIVTDPVVNTFPPVEVIGRLDKGSDILELIDTVTGKTVIEVGTADADDYYPSYVANFTPENMATNARNGRTNHHDR